MDLAINCGCNCPNPSPTGGQNQITSVGGDIGAWRACAAAGMYKAITCGACGCQQDLIDTGSGVGVADTSQPRVDSANIGAGPSAGGTAVTLAGHRLNFGSIVVRFGGVPGVNLRSQSNGALTIDSPAHASGTVDITVENAFGQRAIGGSLVGGFVYS